MSDAAPEWDTPKPGRKSEKRQRSVVVSVRLNQSELEHIQALAEGKGQPIGTYMRERAIAGDVPTWVRAYPWDRYEPVITGGQR